MATVDLKGVYKVTVKGRTYWYAWKGKGAPRLKGEPGTPEFVASLKAAHDARKIGDETRIKALIAMFRQSSYWRGEGHKPISAKTKASWTTWLDRIQQEFGDARVAWFDKPEMRRNVVKWRNKYASTPRAADMGVQVLSRLLSFGQEEGKLMHNICNGISGLYANDRSDLIWTAEDLAKLEAVASPEIMQAARLAALTGLRQGDLLKMRWWHIKERSIEIEASKSGKNGRKPRKAIVPLYGALKDYLATLPKRATTILVNTDGEPWKTGFGSSWGTALERAGIEELHFHDLRGTAATNYALAGFEAREIALFMAWSEKNVQAIIDHYVNRDAILEGRIRRMDEHNARTDAEKLSEKPG
jgi:integrase